ncbi:DUF1552 domain-containing protein [Opitutia bacterium ISCC 51]|nr:DUF1552 domain-containing protein [Opitutae bacterium ISCC 51]QXD28938.1 DUF1552 domain-containing protein [Opitutae bacterium ISCC 52]
MKRVHFSFANHVSRRSFLKGIGVSLALPAMESMFPAFAAAPVQNGPKRLVAVGNSFGMYQPSFFPGETGFEYAAPELLQPLDSLRNQFTVMSNLDHGLTGGHFCVHSFLSGVLKVDAKNMPDGNISVDQRAAEVLGSATRFPTLTVGSSGGLHNGCQMSWTRSGVRVPPISGPRELFRKLFEQDSEAGKKAATERSVLKKSILDSVMADAKSMSKSVTAQDRDKLDEYLTAVRETEVKVDQSRHWIGVAKPDAPMDEPSNQGIVLDLPTLYDLIVLALQTDSTRIASLEISSEQFDASILGVSGGYHLTSHHGQEENKIRDLVKLELYQTQQFANFLGKLNTLQDASTGGSLLNDSMVLFGSGMGNSNAHTNTDLPIILAGGGFKHGQHIALPKEGYRRLPLSNLYLSILHRIGIEDEYFAHSTGTLSQLETT